MFKGIQYLLAAAVLIYFLFYPFLKSAINRKKVIKWILIVYGLVSLIYTVMAFA
ncbi:hypothetical protein [Pontibacter liquoris]|uniref:hypothetical protein n=1 Tax=Pontibacter liquoris TaxID=2905677 RepID=UPI001FA8175C|nr:hypothetical protein [Pontibacter liquoris]